MTSSNILIKKTFNIWNPLMLILVFFVVFVIALFPPSWHSVIYSVFYSLLFISAVMTMKEHFARYLWLAIFAVVTEWISFILVLPVLNTISEAINLIFFAFITGFYIHQIAVAKKVSSNVIFHAVNGYLLLGLFFSILIGILVQFNPGMFNFSQVADSGTDSPYSAYIYFGFVSLSTLGYGDILPLLPAARSLSILISVCGQLYLAIIIALLVGKYASRTG